MRYDPPMWINGHCYGSRPTPERPSPTVTPTTKAKRRAANKQASATRRKNRTRS